MFKSHWLPDMIANSPPALKVWSAGCACGEEVYSFKIIWELLGQQFEHLPALDLLATDRHPRYLERARSGIYNRSSLKEVAPDWRQIYFESRKGGRHFGLPVTGRASNHRVSRDVALSSAIFKANGGIVLCVY